MLRLTTLGATRLTLVGPDGSGQVVLGPGKSVALLTYHTIHADIVLGEGAANDLVIAPSAALDAP